ncbi:MAG: phytanoyl-CoA dioxygenase family protein [Cyclobacteriaceae bacterium]|nr:phytanoyl-CoA dioxygenase family protein [Cyclobacteriaceae bacterium]
MQSLEQKLNIDKETVVAYQQNGYALIKNLATPTEISHYRPLILNAVKKLNPEVRKMEDRDTYGKAFLQTTNLWEEDEQVKEFTLAKKFAAVAAQLMGVEKVRLYHDQALFKEAGGGFTPWHQDQFYWPLNTSNTITMWMPLINITTDMGMLTFAGGSHKDGLVKNLEISDESEKALDEHVAQKKYPVFMPAQMNAGDATFHAGLTLHKAPGNSSSIMREVMTIIYFADGAEVAPPINEWQEKDRERWLLGLANGAKAASRLNPVI